MYYNVGAGWTNSSYPGAWMIRPIVSMEEVFLTEINETKNTFLIYPNPAKEKISIISNTIDNLISIYNLQGILVKQLYVADNECIINISDLLTGMYIVEIKSEKNRSFQKFIIK
mgnify:CR=1 FL=1